MSEQYSLTALPGRPNRVLPIGIIAEGKRAGEPRHVHVHTGSTRLVAAADVPALKEHLEREGIAGDYHLVPLQRTPRGSDHKRGQFARKGGTRVQGRRASSRRTPLPEPSSPPLPSSSSESALGEPGDTGN